MNGLRPLGASAERNDPPPSPASGQSRKTHRPDRWGLTSFVPLSSEERELGSACTDGPTDCADSGSSHRRTPWRCSPPWMLALSVLENPLGRQVRLFRPDATRHAREETVLFFTPHYAQSRTPARTFTYTYVHVDFHRQNQQLY